MNQPTDQTHSDQYLWDERWKVVYRAWLSALYHDKRERFYDWIDKMAKAFAAIGGAAAVSQLLADPNAKIWVAAAVSIVSILSLVFGPAQKARRHAELARDFKKLWAQIEEAGPFPAEAVLYKFRAQILNLEASEPASLRALVKRCENEIALSVGNVNGCEPLSIVETLLMHFVDFAPVVKPNGKQSGG